MDIFSNLQVINECLLDNRRTNIFERAIREVVKKGNVVLDSGTGTGIMALFAARAGAKKVYAVDIAEDVLVEAQKNINANGFKNIIQTINADMKKITLEQIPDVVIMEMLDTGLVAEQQGLAIQQLQQNNIITDHTQLIPFQAENYIQAINYDFNFYGFHMPSIIQARNYGVTRKIKQFLSDLLLYDNVDFRKPFSTKIDNRVVFKAQENGEINAICLRTKIKLTKSISSWGTSDMNMPVIIPVTSRKVKKYEQITFHISYGMGEGYSKLQISFE